jgi:hypothetical protein
MKRLPVPVEFATSGRFVVKARGSLPEALGILDALTAAPTPEATTKGVS